MGGFDGFTAAGNAITSLVGAWYDNRQDTKRMREGNEFNAAEAAKNRTFQADQAAIDRSMQREFAENGIRMRVTDAVAAGLHPLVGAGVNPVSYNPIGVGGDSASSVGYSPSHMGQDVSRAIQATRTATERAEDMLRLKLLESQINETDMRTWGLANEIARKQQSAGQAAPFDSIVDVPVQVQSKDSKDNSRIAGEHALWQKTFITPDLKWDLPASQGENPMESLEGILPQLLTLYKNLYYNPKEKVKAWLREREGVKLLKSWTQKNRAYQRRLGEYHW